MMAIHLNYVFLLFAMFFFGGGHIDSNRARLQFLAPLKCQETSTEVEATDLRYALATASKGDVEARGELLKAGKVEISIHKNL